MPITANALPSAVPFAPAPWDAMNAFCNAQTLAATGYFNNLNSGQLDLGSGSGTASPAGAGRTEGLWCFTISAVDFSSADESYKLHLFGSNDVAFGNGNVELLHFHDLAAVTAGRQVATILGPTPTIPPFGVVGTQFQLPFTNHMQRIVHRYLRMYAVIGGTSPSITLSAWVSFAGNYH